MSKEKICGIYCFKNKISNKLYVGQSQNIYKELSNYVRALKRGKHHNIHLQRAWNKDGEENFETLIIEECSLEKLNEREIYYIKYLKSHSTENGYNLSWGGEAFMRGRFHTDEWKNNMSKKNVW